MWEKPLPHIDSDNKPLFQGYQDHEFKLYRCSECGEWYFPKSYCRNHENEPHFGNINVETASGEGEVFAFTVNHRAFHPGFKDDVPYVFAMIELSEGPLFGTQVIDVETDKVEIGLPVEVSFRDISADEIPENRKESFPLDGGFSLPYFAPTQEAM